LDEAEPCHGCKKVPKKKTAKKTKKFKNRGGSKFTLSVNGNKQHDIILEEMNLYD
jgi:hypothetical protein